MHTQFSFSTFPPLYFNSKGEQFLIDSGGGDIRSLTLPPEYAPEAGLLAGSKHVHYPETGCQALLIISAIKTIQNHLRCNACQQGRHQDIR